MESKSLIFNLINRLGESSFFLAAWQSLRKVRWVKNSRFLTVIIIIFPCNSNQDKLKIFYPQQNQVFYNNLFAELLKTENESHVLIRKTKQGGGGDTLFFLRSLY